MIRKKTSVSARVFIFIKKIVNDSDYSHRDAYELGAGAIAIGKYDEVMAWIRNNPNYDKVVKEKKCKLLKDKKNEIERELDDL